MSFSSRRRNYLLTPHRRDGLIEWMKEMLTHSFVLDALDSTGSDTFSHFEMLIEEHRELTTPNFNNGNNTNSPNTSLSQKPSRLLQLVPTVGIFHTRLPLRKAFEAYNMKYGITKRRHVTISFNEIRQILNLAQIMAFFYAKAGEEGELSDEENDKAVRRWTRTSFHLKENSKAELKDKTKNDTPPHSPDPCSRPNAVELITGAVSTIKLQNDQSLPIKFKGLKMITFDGDQTLYSDGANFESNVKLATYLYLLLRYGVSVAVVTAAGYEYQTAKYELRLSGLLSFFKEKGLPKEDCEKFFLFGGECNYLLKLGPDYKLHAVREYGAGGWITSTKFLSEAPANWKASSIKRLLDTSEQCFLTSVQQQKMRARIVRKKRSVGLVPDHDEYIPREALDETVLRVQEEIEKHEDINLPYCAFNGGTDAWVDVGNKRVGVEILQSYLGIEAAETLHIGDQFLNTGNDYAARDVCPCVWITSPIETTYILKSILRLAGVTLSELDSDLFDDNSETHEEGTYAKKENDRTVNFDETVRRSSSLKMDVYTGEVRTVKK